MAGYLILPDGREIEARDKLVLGRVASADVVVEDSKASRRHAILRVEGSVTEIEDLDSSNGTLLNGKKVHRRALRDGDEIRIGTWAIRFREAGGARAAESVGEELTFDDEAEAFPPSPAARPVASPREPERPAAAPPPTVETLEFLDEVVQVRQAPAPPRSGATVPPRRGAPGKPGAQGGRDRGVLQFHKRPDRAGVLGDDLRQMSGWQRLALWLVAAAFALAAGYLAMQLAL